MDPDQALEDIRNAIADFREDEEFEAQHHAERIIELFEGLDEWLRKGGMKPVAWDTPFTEDQKLNHSMRRLMKNTTDRSGDTTEEN